MSTRVYFAEKIVENFTDPYKLNGNDHKVQADNFKKDIERYSE